MPTRMLWQTASAWGLGVFIAMLTYGQAGGSSGSLPQGQIGGCGRDYLERIEAYIGISGTPLDSKSEFKKNQLSAYWASCTKEDGIFVQIQIDMVQYASKCVALASEGPLSKCQLFRDFYSTHLSPDDLADLSSGIAICVPLSCKYDITMLPILVRMYLFFLAGIADEPNLDPPQLGHDLNVTFNIKHGLDLQIEPVHVAPASEQIKDTHVVEITSSKTTEHVDEAGRCLAETRMATANGAPFGVSVVPLRICEESDYIPEEVLVNIAQCSQFGGRLVLVHFNLIRYTEQGTLEDASTSDGQTQENLRALGEFYTTVAMSLVQDFARGIGFCLPLSCSDAGHAGLSRVMVDLLLALAADANPRLAAIGNSFLPDPRWGLDINSSSWDSIPVASRARMCVPSEGREKEPSTGLSNGTIPARTREGAGPDTHSGSDSSGLGESESLLSGSGFEVPWWYGCDAPGMAKDWRLWARLVRSVSVRNNSRIYNRSMVEAADALINRYWALGQEWAHFASHYSRISCNLEYAHILDFSSNTDFSPAFYMLAGESRLSDARWWRLQSWRQAMEFCPYGFITALYVRARGQVEVGLQSSAVKDFELARKMLGGCSEVDQLDERIWGVRSLDIELFLLREELQPVLLNQPGDTCVVGNGNGTCREKQAQTVGDALGWTHADGSVPEPEDLADVWPLPLQDWRPFVWQAMRINTLVRLWTRDVVDGLTSATTQAVPPRLALLTFPQYLCLFLVPMLLRVWGPQLSLAIFHIGKQWESHEKCEGCMTDYGKRFVVNTPYLQDLPMKMSGKAGTGKTTLHIDWNLELPHHEMLSILRDFMEQQPEVRKADVMLCTSPLWLCTSLRMLSMKPLIALCLPNVELAAPPDLKPSSKHADTLAQHRIRRSAYRHFIRDLPDGPPLKSLLVREDLWRSYHDRVQGEVGFAFPFVGLMSLYIDARYKCSDDANVLVMREGSQHRWAPSLRGRLFFATLKQFETSTSPWRFNVMHFSRQRLSFEEIAKHRAALWIQQPTAGKMTVKDLITMEIPTFTPSKRLQASISARSAEHGCRKQGQANAPWAYTLCREVKYPTGLMQMSPLFRHPEILHFESMTDLVWQLSSLRCLELQAISLRMRLWNQALVADDAQFWRNTILALVTWNAEGQSDQNHAHQGSGNAAAAQHPGERAQPHFQLPVGPAGWEPGGGKLARDTCSSPLAAHCRFENEGSSEQASTGPYECCADAFALEHGPHGLAKSDVLVAPRNNVTSALDEAGNCLVDIKYCKEEVLMYGLHLLQEMPALPHDAAL